MTGWNRRVVAFAAAMSEKFCPAGPPPAGSGQRAPAPAGQVLGSGPAGPTQDRRSNEFVVPAARVPKPGRATTREPSRTGQRLWHHPARALAVVFRLLERGWATAKLAAVFVVVGLTAAAAIADAVGFEPPLRTVEFGDPSPENQLPDQQPHQERLTGQSTQGE